MIKRVGVLTGGGDCPGLNAVLRAVVKTAIGKYGWEVYGFKDGYRGLVLNSYVELKSDDVSGLLDKGGTILGTSNRDNPFSFRIARDGGEPEARDMSDRCIENMEMLDVDALICIGGEGTLTTARDFVAKGMKVVGVPKTIDNDLSGTFMTFGFMTAIETATEAIDKLHSTAESHHRVMILEVMGRGTGWIALEAGIAGGADIILVPEIPYDINKVAQRILTRKNAGKSFSIVVVAEGAIPVGGDATVQRVVKYSPDPIRLGGVGQKVADELEAITGIETRVTVLGHLQRGGRPVPYDRILSTRFGVAAVEYVQSEQFGVMCALQGNAIAPVTLDDAVGKLKKVDPQGELVQIAKSIGVGFGD